MMNRFSALRPYTPPADVLDIFRREFEAAYDEGGIFQLTMHPHVIGYRSRIWIIEELIRLGRSRPGVWFAHPRRGGEMGERAPGVICIHGSAPSHGGRAYLQLLCGTGAPP